MTLSIRHYGPDFVGGSAHKGTREDCTYPGCEWPREGDMATGRTEHGDRTGEITDLSGVLTVIRSSDNIEFEAGDLRKPDWGTYCTHGLKIVEAVPAEHACEAELPPPCTLGREDPFHNCPEPEPCPACHPVGRVVEPWPCTEPGCTPEAFEQVMQEEINEYFEAQAEHGRADW